MNIRSAALVLGALSAVTIARPASAMPLGHASERPRLATPLASTDVDFTAIVALDDCSGSLVQFTTSIPTDHALVLTNGHCYEGGFLNAGQVIVNQDSSRTFTLLGADGNATEGTLTASKIVYATMTGTDITLYELASTFADIESQYGVQPLVIADHQAQIGVPIRVVSGFWKTIYSCTLDGFVYELKESDWTWNSSLRYSEPGCEVIGGTSGSPVLQADTKQIIGINNTINESGERCTLDNPCEVDSSGNVAIKEGVGYAQELYWIYGCLGPNNELALDTAGCQLAKPQAARATN